MGKGLDAWLCIPTVDGRGSHFAWKDLGFKVLAMAPQEPMKVDDFIQCEHADYKGHPWGIYTTMKRAFDNGADICIIGSDDVWPTTDRETYLSHYLHRFPEYDGIMEPSGGKSEGERNLVIVGFVGREFFRRYNGGMGVYDLSYNHFYSDQELAIVSNKLGKLYKNDYIKFDHRHWTKTGENRPWYMGRWKALAPQDEANFDRRMADGFSSVKWA